MNENIQEVFVDGRRVSLPVEINEEEGWVKARVPQLVDDQVTIQAGTAIVVDEGVGTPSFDWKEITLHGEVKVIYNEAASPHTGLPEKEEEKGS